MKLSEMSNTALRVITATVMLAIVCVAVSLEKYGIPLLSVAPFHAIRWLGIFVVMGCIYELVKSIKNTPSEIVQKNVLPVSVFVCLLVLMLISVYSVAGRPLLMLWLLMIIVGADVGGWLFGSIFGGDKLWEKISAHKTWAGQIGGIICGTLMSLLYYKLFGGFVQNAIFIGISISLLSQYGDLTASFIKRKLEIKDFGTLLPGHGGIPDRVDGWIYVLPLIWFIIK